MATVAPPLGAEAFLESLAEGIAIGGHRGMGANVALNGALLPAWRENTVPSFSAAAQQGAAFVEFDVQVTKDGVPVVWHDTTLQYGNPAMPTSCKIAELTVAEFEALGRLSSVGDAQLLSVVRRFKDRANGFIPMAEPMRWRVTTDAPFPRLGQLFQELPSNLAFNIEVKMATPVDLAVTPPEEVNRMVGAILEVVRTYSSSSSQPRPVVFSSFDPDVCRELRARQQQWPVLFLSDGGRQWHADQRRTSIQAALAVASTYQLSGVVLDSGALAASPDSVALARSQGLKVVTYGFENDNPDWVRHQQELGVCAVIVDDVSSVTRAFNMSSGILAAGSSRGAVAATLASAEGPAASAMETTTVAAVESAMAVGGVPLSEVPVATRVAAS